MRGFPLLNVIVAALSLCAAWFVLLPSDQSVEQVADATASADAKTGLLRVSVDGPLDRLLLEFLGEPLIDKTSFPAADPITIEEVTFPEEGIDLWVEASASQPYSLRIEFISEGEVVAEKMIQSQPFGGGGAEAISDSIYLTPTHLP